MLVITDSRDIVYNLGFTVIDTEKKLLKKLKNVLNHKFLTKTNRLFKRFSMDKIRAKIPRLIIGIAVFKIAFR